MKLIDVVKGAAHLVSVNKSHARYSIDWYDSEDKGKSKVYLIDIPLDDIEEGQLFREEKAGMLLKWIRDDIKLKKASGITTFPVKVPKV